MPAVLMNSSLDGGPGEPGLRAVSVDNYGGAREMVRHLVDAGHRTIAFIAGPGDNFDATERLRGYRDELAASLDRKSTRLHSSHSCASRMPSSACKQKKT